MVELEERNRSLFLTNRQLAKANAHGAELMAVLEIKEEEIIVLNRSLSRANVEAALLLSEKESRLEELYDLNQRLQNEIVERKKAEQERAAIAEKLWLANTELNKLATQDPLTASLNRRGLECHLEQLCSNATEGSLSVGVLFVDFDDFKQINEAHGHVGGDMVLRELSQRMAGSLRGGDLLARIGGDEFLALLPNVSDQSLGPIAERFRRSIHQEPVQLTEGQAIATVSIAAMMLSSEMSTIEEILKAAQHLLSESKQEGKNRVTLGPSSCYNC